MISTHFHHHPSGLFTFEKFKAGLLCVLMLLASKPNLHAQQQCDTPYETNCVVTNCNFYSGCTYTLTVNDDTPNATIHYTVFENGYVVAEGTVAPGGQIQVGGRANCYQGGACYPAGDMTGTMYATAPGYSQSGSNGLSF